MRSPPTLPQQSWLERCSTALACVLIGIGLLTILGWMLEWTALVQPFASFPPLKLNSAVAFVIIGAVLLAIDAGSRAWARLALIPASVALLTLAEYVLTVQLGIDELLGRDYLVVQTEYPGRMSPMLAISLLLSSGVLFWRAFRPAPAARSFSEAVIGSVLAAGGFSTLLGYASGLSTVYSWGTATPTSPVAGIMLLLLGVALVLLAWRETTSAHGEAPAWAPMPIMIGCMTLTTLLWLGLRDRELAYVGKSTQGQIDTLAFTIKLELEHQAGHFELLARSRQNLPDNQNSSWIADVHSAFAQASSVGCVSVAILDAEGRRLWSHPSNDQEGPAGRNRFGGPEANPAATVHPARREALQAVRSASHPVLSATLPVFSPATGQLQPGFVIYTPVSQAGQISGYLASEYVYEALFRALVDRLKLHPKYHIGIRIGEEPMFALPVPDSAANPELTLERSPIIAERRVRIAMTPAEPTIAEDRRYLPEVALIAGLGISMLLGLSVHLARGARAGQRSAESSNRKLLAENEERRRVEARLKVSDERLRLALDSTQIGIFEWNVNSGYVYYSPGLWAMLGYDHNRMPSTVEIWQSLIHPEDVPLFRRRTETQLNGSLTFIEPEYRVRARSGEWRWVYTRSKSVATAADGRPTRIVGTVQDITGRREAEIALRESQAEARKLSLVAAKTDNPVLIASPEGKIEWANEAFCRVLEYPLAEVVGRNPGHFMVGRDTNRRTVARIRAALARGQGIGTDIVNYSKSGRKYHLHFEIQPVRGAGGEIVNFIAVGTDITARVETEHQLRRAKAEADDASRAKSEFLASMSHEIRTPMNGVIGMTSLLLETNLAPEQRDFVNTIRTSGEALLTIINDILDFSKIESGKMELERTPLDLPLCVEEALDLFALQAAAKHLEIGYAMAADVPTWIVGDVTRLRQILVNLVNNAVKFTPAGSVSIEVRRVASKAGLPARAAAGDAPRVILEFTVRDTGIGIPSERFDRLFRAFSQIDSSTTRRFGGTGLGLAISQRLCELMGGSIRVESQVGRGSAFHFTIQTEVAPGAEALAALPPLPSALQAAPVLCIEDHPTTQARLQHLFERWGAACILVQSVPAALQAAAGRPQPPGLLVLDLGLAETAQALDALESFHCPRLLLHAVGQSVPELHREGLPIALASKPLRSAAVVQAICGLFHHRRDPNAGLALAREPRIGDEIPLRVLLAEDNLVNQKVALRFLARLGYEAVAASNGQEAVAAVEKRPFDLVLMDLQMPEMDGFEATRQIRARLPAGRQPKIVALTANAMQGDRELCVEAGMDDYISKPVKLHEISEVIRRHFKPAANPAADSQLIG